MCCTVQLKLAPDLALRSVVIEWQSSRSALCTTFDPQHICVRGSTTLRRTTASMDGSHGVHQLLCGVRSRHEASVARSLARLLFSYHMDLPHNERSPLLVDVGRGRSRAPRDPHLSSLQEDPDSDSESSVQSLEEENGASTEQHIRKSRRVKVAQYNAKEGIDEILSVLPLHLRPEFHQLIGLVAHLGSGMRLNDDAATENTRMAQQDNGRKPLPLPRPGVQRRLSFNSEQLRPKARVYQRRSPITSLGETHDRHPTIGDGAALCAKKELMAVGSRINNCQTIGLDLHGVEVYFHCQWLQEALKAYQLQCLVS